jgi:uncharacterized protein
MTHPAPPRFEVLDRDACVAILARNHVGRIAYAWSNHVDIEPLHYVYHDGWLYGRTSEGAKLQVTGGNWWPVAFEVDEVEGLFQWRSVVVHGGFYTLGADGLDFQREEWAHGLELLRTLVPETFTEADPAAFRTVVFRMAVQELTGREAIPGGAPAAGPTNSLSQEPHHG